MSAFTFLTAAKNKVVVCLIKTFVKKIKVNDKVTFHEILEINTKNLHS